MSHPMSLPIAPLMRAVVLLLAVAAVVYFVLCLYAYATQRSQIYFPTPRPITSARKSCVSGATEKASRSG